MYSLAMQHPVHHYHQWWQLTSLWPLPALSRDNLPSKPCPLIIWLFWRHPSLKSLLCTKNKVGWMYVCYRRIRSNAIIWVWWPWIWAHDDAIVINRNNNDVIMHSCLDISGLVTIHGDGMVCVVTCIAQITVGPKVPQKLLKGSLRCSLEVVT